MLRKAVKCWEKQEQGRRGDGSEGELPVGEWGGLSGEMPLEQCPGEEWKTSEVRGGNLLGVSKGLQAAKHSECEKLKEVKQVMPAL